MCVTCLDMWSTEFGRQDVILVSELISIDCPLTLGAVHPVNSDLTCHYSAELFELKL